MKSIVLISISGESKARSHGHPAGALFLASLFAAFSVAFALPAARSAEGSGWALVWDIQIPRHRIQVEHLTNETAKRGYKIVGVDHLAGDKIACGRRREAYLLFGAK